MKQLLIILSCLTLMYQCSKETGAQTGQSKKPQQIKKEVTVKPPVKDPHVLDFTKKFNPPKHITERVSIRAVGDIMFHKPLQKFGLLNKERFHALFKNVKPDLQKADITFGNLEAPISKSYPISGYPRFNGHDDILPAIKEAGFDVLSITNNHTMDKGKKGLDETLAALKKNNIVSVGDVRDKKLPLKVIERKGIKIGFLAFTEYTNGLPIPKKGAKIYKLGQIKKDQERAIKLIKEAKPKVDFLVISLHYGLEYLHKPEKWKRVLARNLLDSGADLILGHHPHVIQEGEKYVTKDGRETFIIYSLGNFVSSQNRLSTIKSVKSKKIYRGDGVILDVQIVKGKHRCHIEKVGYIPTWTYVDYETVIADVPVRKQKRSKKGKVIKLKKRTQKISLYSFRAVNIKKVLSEKTDHIAKKIDKKMLEHRFAYIKNRITDSFPKKTIKVVNKKSKIKKKFSKRKNKRKKKKKI